MERKFIGMLTKNGHKVRAQKIFYRVVSKLAKRYRTTVQKVVSRVFFRIEPSLDHLVFKKGGSNYIYPRRVSPWRAKSLATKWLIQSAKTRPEINIISKLEGEFNDVIKNKGKTITRKIEFHKRAVANRHKLRNKRAWKFRSYNYNYSESTFKKISKFNKSAEKLK